MKIKEGVLILYFLCDCFILLTITSFMLNIFISHMVIDKIQVPVSVVFIMPTKMSSFRQYDGIWVPDEK